MARQVAVVIGVGRSAGAPLPGALEGAKRFVAWAKGNGFETRDFTDRSHPVRGQEIKDFIQAVVEQGDVERLFVFFAGHGVSLGAGNDVWLLSGAERDADAAVNVPRSVLMARRSGIRHVAVFADACRTPPGHSHDGIGGQTLFPTIQRTGTVELDQFYATKASDPALEVRPRPGAEGAAFGVFTECLLDIFEGKVPISLTPLIIDGKVASVLLANVLAQELGDIVADRLLALKINANQEPEPIPGSYPPNFLARIERSKTMATLTVVIVATIAGESAPDARTSVTIAADLGAAPGSGQRFQRIASGASPLHVEVPTGTLCKIQASVQGWRPADGREERIIEVTADHREAIQFVSAKLHDRSDVWGEPELLRTVLVDRQGQKHTRAPAGGIYRVSTEDPLTGLHTNEFQRLGKGEAPRPVPPPLGRDPAAGRAQRLRLRRIINNTARPDYETDTGLSIYGEEPVAAHVDGGHNGLFPEAGCFHVRGRPRYERRGASVVIELPGDRFVVAAMFAGLVGAMTLTGGAVESLIYTPSRGVPWELPDNVSTLVQEFTAQANVAAGSGRFTVGRQHAEEAAKQLRHHKHENPILGVLAAYAYVEAGSSEPIDDMVTWFERFDQPVPYDIVMLSGRQRPFVSVPIYPSFPLLTRGWAYLDPEGLHPAIAAARASLKPSLWAMPSGSGGRVLAAAVAGGELL